MQNLIPLILIGVFVYFFFSRKGGMGCCGGHGGHEHQGNQNEHSGKSSDGRLENVIDLREDEYKIISSKTISSPETNKRHSK
jgi:hypothetical protein